MCYIEEPNVIWRHRNAFRTVDMLTDEDVTPHIKGYIRSYFRNKLNESRRQVCLEKTPTNCLRLRFLSEIFPEAKFIFIERDVHEIAHSAYKKWTKEVDGNTERLYPSVSSHRRRHFKLMVKRFLSVPWSDLVFYIPKVVSEICFMLLGIRRQVWGPKYTGIHEDLNRLTIQQVCLKQAKICQEEMHLFRHGLSPDSYLFFNYADLVKNPQAVTDEVFAFMKISRA